MKKNQREKNKGKKCTMAESQWEQIGLVTIDTGSLLLIDPAHADAIDAATLPVDDEVVLDDAKQTAVVTTTGMGDGNYLVEGRYHKDTGRLAEIRVKFLDDEGGQLCYKHP